MWTKEELFQKSQEFLCTIVTNCGINSQSFHKGFHSLKFVMCNGRLVPIFTCRCSQSNKKERWKFLFMCSKVTGCRALSLFFFFFLNETITLFYCKQMLTFEGSSSRWQKEKASERQGPYVLSRLPPVLFDNSACPWGSPPENKVCISINQLLMKAFWLRKKLARCYNIHVFRLLQQSVSEVEVNDKIFQITALMNQRTWKKIVMVSWIIQRRLLHHPGSVTLFTLRAKYAFMSQRLMLT